MSLYHLGELPRPAPISNRGWRSMTPADRSLAFRSGRDPGVVCLTRAAVAPWVLGYPDQALQRSYELAVARELSHPFSLVYALLGAVARRSGGMAASRARASRGLVALATEQGFAQLSWRNICGAGHWPSRGRARRALPKCVKA